MKKSLMFSVALIGCFIGLLLNVAGIELPAARLTLHVIDEERNNLSGIDAEVTFLNPVHKPGRWGSSDTFNRSGKTGLNGLFIVEERAGFEVHYGASGAGYYKTTGRLDFETEKDGRYQPWDPIVDVILKKRVNPIPMYARRVNKAVPAQNEDLGFDMFVGDFVAPYGQGNAPDMIFRLEVTERTKKDYDYKLTVAFPNTADGILPFNPISHLQGSALRSLYSTPEKGFLPSWTVTRSRRPGSAESSNYDPEKHGYYFRIRSSVDKSGKILSANYGKMYGDFMNFTYYLNPTSNDRNVEFDPKRNLFTDLKDHERVTMP